MVIGIGMISTGFQWVEISTVIRFHLTGRGIMLPLAASCENYFRN